MKVGGGVLVHISTDYVFGGIDKANYTITPISIKNYPVYYQSKDLDEYIQFIESTKN